MISDAFTLGNLAGEFDWSFLWNNFKVCFVLLVSETNQVFKILKRLVHFIVKRSWHINESLTV